MANKIKTVSAGSDKQILFMTQPYAAVGAVMSATGAVDVDGRKVQKAGTPVTGDLTARATEFTVATSDAVGVLVHDVDVTEGAENATVLLFGFVDLNKVDDDVAAKIETAKASLDGKVTFLK